MADETRTERNLKQAALLERARSLTPGASQTRSKAPGAVGPLDDFPLFAVSGSGCTVCASDGNSYVDCAGANAAVPLGYRHPAIFDAIRWEDPLLSLPSTREADVSDQFLKVCAPWAESVRWVKTGSEAMSAAVKIARAETGRTKVVVFDNSYHGWHDWTMARFANEFCGNGVPLSAKNEIDVLPYGQPVRVGTDVAAVIVEGHRFEQTQKEWLDAVVESAHVSGALVIFDEMVYGLRWANGGLAEMFSGHPDLSCFGKALGNGYSVACVCGSRDVMRQAESLVSSTYGGDMIGLSAASAVLRIYSQSNIVEKLQHNGSKIMAAFRAVAPDGFAIEKFPVHWRIVAPSDELMGSMQRIAADGLGIQRVLFSKTSNNASAVMDDETATKVGHVLGLAACYAKSGAAW